MSPSERSVRNVPPTPDHPTFRRTSSVETQDGLFIVSDPPLPCPPMRSGPLEFPFPVLDVFRRGSSLSPFFECTGRDPHPSLLGPQTPPVVSGDSREARSFSDLRHRRSSSLVHTQTLVRSTYDTRSFLDHPLDSLMSPTKNLHDKTPTRPPPFHPFRPHLHLRVRSLLGSSRAWSTSPHVHTCTHVCTVHIYAHTRADAHTSPLVKQNYHNLPCNVSVSVRSSTPRI